MVQEFQKDLSNGLVSVRCLPFPYRAMLAICSDLDETQDRNVYFETMRYLNTTEKTSMGEGIGFEVGNSIYFDMPAGQFSYWNTDEEGREMIRTLIRSGHVDCLHSYGDLATTRQHAERALSELSKYDCKLDVWIDHSAAPCNFGRDIMRGQGDVVGSDVYHADLTTAFGIRYTWTGRVTSVIGQDVRRRLNGLLNRRHPVASSGTLLKEFTKGLLAHGGISKYAMHGRNQVIRETHLRSGQQVCEFMRSSPHWGGVSFNDRADGLSEVLTEKILSRLVDRGGVCILYVHLGKFTGKEPFSEETKNALGLLAQYSRVNKIQVTTTSRLLRYCRMIRGTSLSSSQKGEHLVIDVHTQSDEKDLDGLSIYTPAPDITRVLINGVEMKNLQHNPPDCTGRPSVSIPWLPLKFPESLY